MDMIPTEVQLLLSRTRNRTLSILESRNFRWETAPRGAHKKLFKQLRFWFPRSHERNVRLGLLMAMLGSPISSQNDIPRDLLSMIIEVTDVSENAYLTSELSTQLQALVESAPDGTAWQIPAAEFSQLAVSDL